MESAVSGPGMAPAGQEASSKGEGLAFSMAVNGEYDSNLFLAETGEVDDFSAVVAPSAWYRSAPSGGALVILEGRYSPILRGYIDRSDLDTLDHIGSVALRYDGGRLRLALEANASRVDNANRFAVARTRETRYGAAFSGEFEFSKKTYLEATLQASSTEYDGALLGEDRLTMELGARWIATPRIHVGPTIEYSILDSANLGSRKELEFLLGVDYDMPGRIDLSAQAGVRVEENSRFGGGFGNAQFVGELSGRYMIGDFWTLAASVRYDTYSSPTHASYAIDDLAVLTSLSRSLPNGSIWAGFGINDSNYRALGPAVAREDDQMFAAYLGHQMRVFHDRLSLFSTIRFSAASGFSDWDRIQVSSGFNFQF